MNLPPKSGSEHVFTLKKWGGKVGVKNNNCYAYAVNDFVSFRQSKAQPGERANIKGNGPYDSCKRLNESVIADNPKRVYAAKAMTKCKPGYYKIMMFISKCKRNAYLCQGDFHFYKQHSKTEYKVKKDDTHESIAAFFSVPVIRVKRAAAVLKRGEIITFKADFFSHKRGWATGPLITGAHGKLIKDPRTISRDYPGINYDTICSSFCVKNTGVKVGHTHPKIRKNTV
jgi:LysM repeat protein